MREFVGELSSCALRMSITGLIILHVARHTSHVTSQRIQSDRLHAHVHVLAHVHVHVHAHAHVHVHVHVYVTCFRFQVSGFRFQVSGYKLQVTGHRLQALLVELAEAKHEEGVDADHEGRKNESRRQPPFKRVDGDEARHPHKHKSIRRALEES